MGNVVIERTKSEHSNTAAILSFCERTGILTLVLQYENGEDMTEKLQKLLEIQENKMEYGIQAAYMRAEFDRPDCRRLWENLAKVVREGRERRRNQTPSHAGKNSEQPERELRIFHEAVAEKHAMLLLLRDHEEGRDLTDRLESLLCHQPYKKEMGITRAEFLAVQDRIKREMQPPDRWIPPVRDPYEEPEKFSLWRAIVKVFGRRRATHTDARSFLISTRFEIDAEMLRGGKGQQP